MLVTQHITELQDFAQKCFVFLQRVEFKVAAVKTPLFNFSINQYVIGNLLDLSKLGSFCHRRLHLALLLEVVYCY